MKADNFPDLSTAAGGKAMPKRLLRRMTLTAVFTALAVAVKLIFSIPLPLFGAGGMKIGLTGVFTAFPAIMFGPLYGGFSSAMCDILGYIVKPDGAYVPWLTLTAFAGGCIKGLLWMAFSECYGRTGC